MYKTCSSASRLRRDQLRTQTAADGYQPSNSTGGSSRSRQSCPRSTQSAQISNTILSHKGYARGPCVAVMSSTSHITGNAIHPRPGNDRCLHPSVAISRSRPHLQNPSTPHSLAPISHLPRSQTHSQSETRPPLRSLAREVAFSKGDVHDTQPTHPSFVTHATSSYATPPSTLLDRNSPLMDDLYSSAELNISSSTRANISPDLSLSRLIKSASTWTEIQHICLQHPHAMEPQHLATLVTHLAQMQVRGQVPPLPSTTDASSTPKPNTSSTSSTSRDTSSQADSLPGTVYSASDSLALSRMVQQLIPQLEKGLLRLSARQVACVVWALAKLGHPAGRTFTSEALLPRAQLLLPFFDAQNLTMVAWALAAWQARISSPTHTADIDSFSTSDLFQKASDPSNPGPSWIAAFLDRCHTQLELPAFTPRQLSNTLWALARLGIDPGTTVLPAFYVRAAAVMPQFNAIDVSSTLVALSVLSAHTRSRVPPELVASLIAQLIQELPSATDQSVANSLWALAALRICPGHADMDLIFKALQPRARQLHPRALSQVLWACATLSVIVPQDLLLEMLRATRGPVALAAFSPQSLSNILWALAAAGLGTTLVQDGWMASFLTTVQVRLTEFSPQSISNLITALCKLKVTAQPEWMSAAVNQLHRSREPSGPQATANVLWALAKMGYSFNTQGLDAMVTLVGRRLPALQRQLSTTASLLSESTSSSLQPSIRESYNPQEVANILWALAKFKHPPAADVMAGLLLQVEPQLKAAAPQEMANIMWALATLEATVPDSWLLSAETVFAPKLNTYTARDLSQLAYALATLRPEAGCNPYLLSSDVSPCAALTIHLACGPELVQHALRVLPKCSSQDLANLCWGLVKLRVPIGSDLTAAVAAQLVTRYESLEAPHLAVLLWALGKMEHKLTVRDMRTLEDATYMRMPQMGIRELSTTVWGFAAMGQAPSPDWLSDFTGQLRNHSGTISDEDWAMILRSLSTFRSSTLGPEIEDLLVSELEPRLGRLSPSAVTTILHSCGTLGHASPSLLARALGQVRANMSSYTPNELSSVLWACARLDHAPGAAFISAFESQGLEEAGVESSHLACYAWALAKLRVDPSPVWLASFISRLSLLLPCMSSKEVATTTWSLAAWRAVLPAQLLDKLTTAYGVLEVQWDARTRTKIKKALGRLRVRANTSANSVQPLLESSNESICNQEAEVDVSMSA